VAAEMQTLPALLAWNSAVHKDKLAVVADGKSLTYSDLDRASRKLAARLVAAGIGKSSRVGILMPNGTEWVLSASALGRVGACIVPLSTLLRPPEVLAQLQTAAVTHLIAAGEFRGRFYLEELEEVAPNISAITGTGRRHPNLPALRRVWSFEDLPKAEVDPAVAEALESAVRPADDLVTLFTSGSRGAPEGVIHTHGSSIRATAAGLAGRGVGPGERLYIPMPFFGVAGFSGGLMTALVAGATLLTEADLAPETTIGRLERERVTLTESFGAYGGDGPDTDLPSSKHGSCGRPFEGIEVRISDPETRIDMPTGGVGEIRLRGPNLMRAICGRTREEIFDKDGFYRTGDLGALDADGYLWYHGRRGDTFAAKGVTG
jgi:acyl-CoA synthetase (AMP-forming)/AMP-acid ligase II